MLLLRLLNNHDREYELKEKEEPYGSMALFFAAPAKAVGDMMGEKNTVLLGAVGIRRGYSLKVCLAEAEEVFAAS